MAADNIALVRQYIERFLGANDQAAADALLTEGFLYNTGLSPDAPLQGRETAKQAIAGLHQSFPDIRLVIEDIFAGEGERVVVRFKATGTHCGSLMGIAPTGKQIAMIETHVVRLRDGKIIEDYASDNNYDFPFLIAPAFQ